MKKILSISLYSDPRCQGGVETFNRNLKYMFNNQLDIITEKNNHTKLYKVDRVVEVGSTNILFRGINNKILKNRLKEYLVIKKIKEISPSILIFSFPYEVFLLKNIKAKKIMVQHTNYNNFIVNYCKNKKEYIEAIKNNVDYLITLSEYDRKKFIKELNYDPKKIKIIRHSSNIELLKETKTKNKKLIMLARIDNHSKRFDLAIKAMKKLPDFELNIYGNTYNVQDKEYLINLIEKNELNNVKIHPATNQVKEKLDESGIYIMTSDYEAYGIVNIEAMRRGLPIILRNTFEAAPDVVVNNKNGILLDKEWNEDKFVEAIRKVYDNYEYYSENSKKLGERHSPEVIKKEWDKLLLNIESKKEVVI